MPPIFNDSDQDWREFGKSDPYFAVVTKPMFRGRLSSAAREEFFKTGEAHIDAVFSVIRSRFDAAFTPQRALDFGCGVGRLVIPLAKRTTEVTGMDISPAMLAEAAENCRSAGVGNVILLESDGTLSALTGEYDLVHSYIVLQHIAVSRGEDLVRILAGRLSKDGIGVFHVTYSRAALPLHSRILYWARTRVPGAHTLLNIAMGRALASPVMQINEYSITRLLQMLSDSGCGEVHVRYSDHDGNRGVLLFARKSAMPVFS